MIRIYSVSIHHTLTHAPLWNKILEIMSKIPTIRPLSETQPTYGRRGDAVVMVGSFAPIHEGHFDALHSASDAVIAGGKNVDALILTPNSGEYLRGKLGEESEE